jgi:hypothetical protein
MLGGSKSDGSPGKHLEHISRALDNTQFSETIFSQQPRNKDPRKEPEHPRGYLAN